jgi:hypothetical protein
MSSKIKTDYFNNRFFFMPTIAQTKRKHYFRDYTIFT